MKKLLMLSLLLIYQCEVAAQTYWDNVGPRTISTTNNANGVGGSIPDGYLSLDYIEPVGIGTQLSIVSGGRISKSISLYKNATLDMSGDARVDVSIFPRNSSSVTLSGTASVGNSVSASDSATVMITDDVSIGNNLLAEGNANISVQGNPYISNIIMATNNGTIDIYVTEFE